MNAAWVETQELPPDEGVELPPMAPELADDSLTPGAELLDAQAVDKLLIADESATPSPTDSATPSDSPSPADSATPSDSPSPTDAPPAPTDSPSPAGSASPAASASPADSPPPTDTPSPTSGASPTQGVTVSPSPTVAPVSTADPVIRVPLSGYRTFSAATGRSPIYGYGAKLITYRVEVERGIPGWTPSLFASRVDPIIADKRGWRASGKWRFQRVPGGTLPSLYIRLATPKTVDYFCGKYGIHTLGKYSCRYGKVAMINLMRWVYAVPHFNGDLVGYRRMVVNHETGHFLGYKHMLCPGWGRLAPVMQTQTIALKGCRRNSWPYPDGVHFVTGPPA